ncbi:MAG TPA: extracellular solute-binding protein [Gaiellaceae bacterium]|nr:extracellular solute-binding protein [Gaiellaceae bacterium]
MTRSRWLFLLLALLGALALTAAGCGGDDEEEGGATGTGAAEPSGEGGASGEIAIMGVWTGAEQQAFQAVIDGFNEQNPDVTVNYTAAGDQLPTQISTAVEGGNPPDVATLPQPGLMRDLVARDALIPLDFAAEDIETNLGESAVELGTVDGTLYGFIFKAANKSTVWYNVQAFEDAGVEPAATYEELIEAGNTIQQSGLPAYSIGGADGWTLTDLFENIYLRQAGPETYDQLAEHEIKWTDQSVKDALTTMGEILSQKDNMVGNPLQTDFPTSVSNVFAANPKAAMVIEGDFVPGSVESNLEAETGYNVFEFPSVDGSEQMIVGGGDTIVAFKDNPATQAFVKYLTTSEAAEIWAQRGGFASLNKDLDPSVYPDAIQQETSGALAETDIFRFDLSDLQPSEFGGTVGQGLFKLFQDFLADPDDVDGIAKQMEQAAAEAYGK